LEQVDMGNNHGCCFRIIYHCIFVIFFLNRLFFGSNKESIEMAVSFSSSLALQRHN
jgi:hypothetical protein